MVRGGAGGAVAVGAGVGRFSGANGSSSPSSATGVTCQVSSGGGTATVGDDRSPTDPSGNLDVDGAGVATADRGGSTSRPLGTGMRNTSPQSRHRDRFPASIPSISYCFLHLGQFKTMIIPTPWIPRVDEGEDNTNREARPVIVPLILSEVVGESTEL